jgi:6-phosphogluconate dehydrogenase
VLSPRFGLRLQGSGYLVDKIVDQTGSKGTGKWTVQQAADLSVAAPTITASLDGRYMSAIKPERAAAAQVGWGEVACTHACLLNCLIRRGNAQTLLRMKISVQVTYDSSPPPFLQPHFP